MTSWAVHLAVGGNQWLFQRQQVLWQHKRDPRDGRDQAESDQEGHKVRSDARRATRGDVSIADGRWAVCHESSRTHHPPPDSDNLEDWRNYLSRETVGLSSPLFTRGVRHLANAGASVAHAVGSRGALPSARTPHVHPSSLIQQAAALRLQDAVTHYQAALLAWQIGHVHAGEVLLRRAIALRPAFAPAHLQLGRVFIRQGHREEGREALIEAIRLNPRLPVPPTTLACWISRRAVHQRLRGCLRTCHTSQAPDHEMNHRDTDHGFTGLGHHTHHPSISGGNGRPGERPLHDPAFRQSEKPLDALGPLDNLQGDLPPGAQGPYPGAELPRIGLIRPDQAQAGARCRRTSSSDMAPARSCTLAAVTTT